MFVSSASRVEAHAQQWLSLSSCFAVCHGGCAAPDSMYRRQARRPLSLSVELSAYVMQPDGEPVPCPCIHNPLNQQHTHTALTRTVLQPISVSAILTDPQQHLRGLWPTGLSPGQFSPPCNLFLKVSAPIHQSNMGQDASQTKKMLIRES